MYNLLSNTMKFYHLIAACALFIVLGSCSSVKNIFSTKESQTFKNVQTIKQNCPKANIPFKTSFVKKSDLEVRIIKVVSNCKIDTKKDSLNKKESLVVNFEIYFDGSTKDNINKRGLNKVIFYVSIVNSQNKILTKLLVPVKQRDLNDTKKFSFEGILNRSFKFIYNKKDNENLRIFYGFQSI